MNWTQGQPCSQCGKPTEMMLHRFWGGDNEWSYLAPLYHDVEQQLGFCDVKCSFEWSKVDYTRIDAHNKPMNSR